MQYEAHSQFGYAKLLVTMSPAKPSPQANKPAPANDAPIAQAVLNILSQAHQSRATDIHIEPRDTLTQIRFRIDGTLRDSMTLPQQLAPAVMSRLKMMSQLKVDESLVPQNGRLKTTIGNDIFEARVSVLPVVGGEKIVIRILDDATKVLPLDKLGLNAPAYEIVKKRLDERQGLILVTGPSGSGKTTTLYSALTHVNTKDANISTIEDPVEYSLPGINQTQVDVRTGVTFANGLRAVLRQDPNVIMVGELSDNETTSLALQATMSGHAVLAGTYTKDAASALPRLFNMNLEPFLVATTVKAVIAQRLVRRLCPQCKEAYKVTTGELDKINKSFVVRRAIDAFHTLQSTGALPSALAPLTVETDTPDKATDGERPMSESRKVIPVPAELTTGQSSILSRIAQDPSMIDRPNATEEETAALDAFASQPSTIADTAPTNLGSPSDLTLYRAKGCQQCGNSGYFGRLGIFEVLNVSPKISQLVTEQATDEAISAQAINEGMMTMQEDGFIKALQGFTTVDEIIHL